MCVHVDATVGLHTPSYARLSPRESGEGFPEGFLSSVLMERLSATATCTASESPARHIATCKLEHRPWDSERLQLLIMTATVRTLLLPVCREGSAWR